LKEIVKLDMNFGKTCTVVSDNMTWILYWRGSGMVTGKLLVILDFIC